MTLKERAEELQKKINKLLAEMQAEGKHVSFTFAVSDGEFTVRTYEEREWNGVNYKETGNWLLATNVDGAWYSSNC